MHRAVIIGAGNIAAGFDNPNSPEILTHAHACQCHPAFHLLGFYDKDCRRAKEAAEKWGCYAFETLDDALREAEIISCCVPDQYHKQVLEEISPYNPKLVIAEKPLAASLEEAEAIRQIYDGRIPLILNYSRRFLPEFHKLREEIGEYGRFLKGVGYYGKGILHNGSHMLDLLRFLLGAVECLEVLPTEVQDLPGDVSKDVLLRVQGEAFHMLAIDSRAVTVFELELFFEKARIRILDGGTVIEKYEVKESALYKGYYNYFLRERENVNYSNAMMGLFGNVQEFLEHGADLSCTLKDGLDVLRLCMQIRGEL